MSHQDSSLSLLLPATFSPLSKQHYRLTILQPANPSGQSLCSHYPFSRSHGFTGFFRQTKNFSNSSQGLSHPPHLLLCLFSSNLWEGFPTPCTQRFLLAPLSLPHVHFPASLPQPLSPSLPSASLSSQLKLGSPLLGSSDSPQQWSNALYVCDFNIFLLHLSITSPRTLPWLFPLPQESLMRSWQYTACQDSFQPSAIHRGTFTAPLAVPSQHQRQRDGGVLRT